MLKNLAFSFGFLCLSVAVAQAQVMTDMGGPAPQVAMPQGPPMQGGGGPGYGESYFNGGSQQCNASCNDSCQQCQDCCSYVKFFGGWTQLQDFETFNQNTQVFGSFDNGYGFGGALGKKIRPMLNVECEFTYRNNEASDLEAHFFINGQNGQVINTTWDGEVNTYSGMTNLMLEGCRRVGRITPYAGAGFGVGFVNAAISSQFGDYTIDDTGFAYQFIGGVSRAVSCNADMFLEYRYFAIEDNHVLDRQLVCIDDFDYRTDNVFFGLRLCR